MVKCAKLSVSMLEHPDASFPIRGNVNVAAHRIEASRVREYGRAHSSLTCTVEPKGWSLVGHHVCYRHGSRTNQEARVARRAGLKNRRGSLCQTPMLCGSMVTCKALHSMVSMS